MPDTKTIIAVVFFAVLLTVSGLTAAETLEQGFVSPPESVKTGVYYYWVNDHLSAEGVDADLRAMKKAGINRVFIGSNIVSGDEFGKTKVFSKEWYDAVHTAMKTSTELGIEVGMFNCPGWSQSGGPWVKPEQAMRYLAAIEMRQENGKWVTSKELPKHWQDVKVLAVPVSAADFHRQEVPPLTKKQTVISFGKITAKSVNVVPGGYIDVTVDVQVSGADLSRPDWKSVKKFGVKRTIFNADLGFDRKAPETFNLDIQDKEVRVVIDKHGNQQSKISQIAFSESPAVEQWAEKTLATMPETNLPAWNEYKWDNANSDRLRSDNNAPQAAAVDSVLDITDKLKPDGTLDGNVPQTAAGRIILRLGMVPTGVVNSPASPEGTGLEVDKMSKPHVASHFDGFCGELMRRIPEADRKSWKWIVQDSYEKSSQNFTDGMIPDFKTKFGYDPTPYLPAMFGLIIGSQDESERFLWDLRRYIADKVSYDFVGGFADVAHKNGMKVWLETYGHWGFPGEFLQYGGQADGVGGEFWYSGGGAGAEKYENRVAASCGHIYGKNVISAESFTSGGPAFAVAPANLRRLCDWSMTEGINEAVFHVYITQPYQDQFPGVDAWFGTEFNRKNTWFRQFDVFTQYVKRCNWMLQQGQNVADIAYFVGEDCPVMTGIREPEVPKGYNYDYINAEQIEKLTVKNGKLVLPHGTEYGVLVLPPSETMRPAVLKKIVQLTKDGGKVIGQLPKRSPSLANYPKCDGEVRLLASEFVRANKAAEQVPPPTSILPPPDCLPDNDAVRWTHRKTDVADIYFLSNQSSAPVQFAAAFRVAGKQPELWDAVSGTHRHLSTFGSKDGITTVPLKLTAAGSCFIVFSQAAGQETEEKENFPEPETVLEITTPWQVQFESDAVHRGPKESVEFKTLTDWSKNENEAIRYYSGTAVYRTAAVFGEQDVKRGETSRYYLEFGGIGVNAKVKVNGKYAGGLWTAPYRVDITDCFAQPIAGGSKLNIEIEVVNNWKNRLVGDAKLPEKDRIVKSDYARYGANEPLQPSGLFGPVRIVVSQ
ncbi:MAG: hypothetical protein LBN39_13395 [Planctomycetaceae bacterium]|jgi:hypothetical protein|nr:hypothetical protein [Planctomycetaceae bacterium]